MSDNKIRCSWGDTWASGKDSDPQMRDYHDNEWGKPCRDERKLFEMLTLEGAQAGLSWATILHKRENYRAAFDDWDIAKIAAYDEAKIAQLLANQGIVRNRLKIRSAVTNAQATLKLGSLSDFIWGYVDGKPIDNGWAQMSDVPAKTELSDRISKDMKKLGFKFVGSTIVYSYLQAVGVVNDHIESCAFRGGQSDATRINRHPPRAAASVGGLPV
ncbi:MAG: DNA-3-methyladenine glycosylase I [Acidaminococcales bacterium]|jgi:DNA-3-methyladenine glycosylase I|nr:DNA-3-methyladenine glycosylase I [Acidaminococcales bacterium]